MHLTPQQAATLKAFIETDALFTAILASPMGDGDKAFEIAIVLNQSASPDYIVWRTSVPAQEWNAAMFGGGGATQLDALTASKRDSLFKFCEFDQDPSNASIRAAVDDFCGSQNTLKAAMQAVQKRKATVGEKLFAIGTGTTVSPATMAVEGPLDINHVQESMGW